MTVLLEKKHEEEKRRRLQVTNVDDPQNVDPQ